MMDQEFGALSGELDRNAQSANYNGISLINNAGNTAAKTIFDQNISKGVTFAVDAKMNISIDGTALTKTIDFTANEKLSADDIVGKINQALKGKGANATLNSAGHLIIKSDTRVSSDGTTTTPATSAITITDAPKELDSTTKPTNIPGKAGFGDIVINVGSSGNKYDNIYLKTVDLSAEGLGLKGASLTNSTGLDETLSTLKAALDTVTEQRSHLGASQKRLTFASDNLQNVKNNTDASLSSIEDTDYAATTMQLAKEKVLNSASQAMLGQSNQMQSEVTQLLK
jgi:flagellin